MATKQKKKITATLTYPKIEELWMLWSLDRNDWMVAVDDPPGYEAYLCATSQKAAMALQKHQKDVYDVDTIPVRII